MSEPPHCPSREPNDVRESLNLGCGRKRIDGALNLDISSEVGADVVHDLNQMPPKPRR